MTTDELMIGNYVFNTELGKIDIITDIEENRVGLKNAILPYTPISLIKPEPITKNWFKKFHPYLNYYETDLLIDRFRLIWRHQYKYWYVIDKENFTYLTKIEFIHEWQNFYKIMNKKNLS